MKKTLFTLACMAALTTAQAQTEKGRWLVGAQVGNFSYSDQNSQRSFSSSLTPSAGYFVTNGLVVGTGVPLSISLAKSTSSSEAKYASTSYGLSPFVRYYLGSAKLKPYMGIAYSYSRTHSDLTLPSKEVTETKGYESIIKPTLGVAYFVTPNVALNVGLDYNIQHQKTQYTDSASGVVTYSSNYKSLSLGIGFQLFFGS